MSLGTAQIIQGNALALPLADSSVDLVCTSPPYFGLRSYQDGGAHYAGQIGSEPTPAEFLDALIAATQEMVRVLKPTGSIFVDLGDKYAQPGKGERNRHGSGSSVLAESGSHFLRSAVGQSYGDIPGKSLMGLPWRYAIACIDQLGLILRAEIIWSKPNGLPESVTDRVRRSHEQWFHFTRQPRYFAAVDEIREQGSTIVTSTGAVRYRRPGENDPGGTINRQSDRYTGKTDMGGGGFGGFLSNNPLGKLPGSVWTIPTQPLEVPPELGVDHFAAYPMEWPRRIIQGWTPTGGTVLDPFMGTGTTLVVARALGRNSIGVDLSADYCRLAQWRINNPQQLAAALQVKKPDVIPAGQLSLFEDGMT